MKYRIWLCGMLLLAALSGGCKTAEIKNEETKMEETKTEEMEEKIDLRETVQVLVPNPIRASSPEEFEEMGIVLELPPNEDWIRDRSYTTISGEIAQIRYYDGEAEAEVTLRAGKEDAETLAGIYYTFDDSLEETWGSTHKIRLQYAVEGGEVVGVLASWTMGELSYTMWGEFTGTGEYQSSPIAKAALYTAEHASEHMTQPEEQDETGV